MPQERYEFDIRDLNLPQLTRRKVLGALAGILAIWLVTGIYIVEANELGVVLRFGQLNRITESGLRYHLPFPFEAVETPKVTAVQRVEIGFRTVDSGPPARFETVPEESLMLTGDENIIDINMIVQFRIKDPADFLFQVQNVEGTVRSASEATLRQVIGNHLIDEALTDGKFQIQSEISEHLQVVLDLYDVGVQVVAVQLQDVHPPEQVVAAFKDVASALEDRSKADQSGPGLPERFDPPQPRPRRADCPPGRELSGAAGAAGPRARPAVSGGAGRIREGPGGHRAAAVPGDHGTGAAADEQVCRADPWRRWIDAVAGHAQHVSGSLPSRP